MENVRGQQSGASEKQSNRVERAAATAPSGWMYSWSLPVVHEVVPRKYGNCTRIPCFCIRKASAGRAFDFSTSRVKAKVIQVKQESREDLTSRYDERRTDFVRGEDEYANVRRKSSSQFRRDDSKW